MCPERTMFLLAPRAGFEPATIRLTVGCSTAELPRNSATHVRERAAYNKASSACIGRNVGCAVGPPEPRKSVGRQQLGSIHSTILPEHPWLRMAAVLLTVR